jgi:hypothetical protein
VHATLPTAVDGPSPALSRRFAAACEAKFNWVMAGLLLIAGCIRLTVLWEFWSENPFATLPTLDSALYWQRAGEIAAGNAWTGEPFHIAPFYAGLLGLFRSVGGGLLGLYALQTVLHLGTAVALAAATRVRFGGAAGCLSDRFGPGRLFFIGMMGWSAFSLCFGLVQTFWLAIQPMTSPRVTLTR